MKTIFFLMFPAWIYCQNTTFTAQLYAEVKDTCEIAYHERFTGRWITEGFNRRLESRKDSVGIDSFQLVRYYFMTPTGQKIYSELAERRYKGVRKAKSDLFSFN